MSKTFESIKVSEEVKKEVDNIFKQLNEMKMIQANELRIGNWIDCYEVDEFGNDFYKSYQISISDLWNIEYDKVRKNEYEPILLTEEWLVWFGFDRINPKYPNKLIYCIKKFYIKYDVKQKFFYWASYGSNTDYKIKHVHHLQNLYFALIGEELTLK